MRVRFNDVGEFLEEVTKDIEWIERKLVRVTTSFRRDNGVPIWSVYLMATCVLLHCDQGVPQILYLNQLMGTHMGAIREFKDTKEGKALIEMRDNLIDKLKALECELRLGTIEE
jgi:hypothetical protein